MATDFKSLGRIDQGVLISGAIAVVLTFFGAYVSASSHVDGRKYGGGESAWHGWSLPGSLLLVGALVIIIFRIFAPAQLPPGVRWNLLALAAAALGTVILVLKALTYGPPEGLTRADISTGPGWSGWMLLVVAIAFTVLAALSLRDSGEKMPDFKKKKNTPPAA